MQLSVTCIFVSVYFGIPSQYRSVIALGRLIWDAGDNVQLHFNFLHCVYSLC